MRSTVHRSSALAALLIATGSGGYLACGSGSSNPPPIGDVDGGYHYEGGVRDAPPPVDSPTDTQPPVDASPGDGPSDAPFGNLMTVDEPDTPCVQNGGVTTELFAIEAGTGNPTISTLGMLGTQRFGGSNSYPGFTTFDPAGTNPQFFPLTVGPLANAFATEGTTVGGAGFTMNSVLYQRYDAMGNGVGTPVTLGSPATPPDSVWIGSGSGGTMVIWEEGNLLHAQGITPTGMSAGPTFDLGPGNYATSLSVIANGVNFAIAWTTPSMTSTSSSFATLSLTGMVGTPVSITSSSISYVVQKLALTTTGFAVLVAGSQGDNHVYLVLLDTTGKVVGPAHRYLGADVAWDIVANGSELGLVIESNDLVVDGAEGPRTPEFRPLSATGYALGPWVCFGGPVGADAQQGLAIAADLSGYAVAFVTPTHHTSLVRFDHLGTGMPH